MISRSIVPAPSAELMEAEKTFLAEKYEFIEKEEVGIETYKTPDGGTMHKEHNPLGSREGRGTLLSLLVRREEAFEQNMSKSDYIFKIFFRFFPSSSFMHIGTSLAKTGVNDLTRFRQYWWKYRSQLMEFYENKIVDLSIRARSMPEIQERLWSLPPEELGKEMKVGAADIPAPRFPRWEAGLWMYQTWVEILLLFLWGASFFLVSLVLFNRSKIL